MPVEGKEMREIMEAQFDVNNKDLMSRLHPQTAEPQLPTNRSHRESRLDPGNNEGRIVAEIKLESEDSDSDVQVVSDDECQVVEAKIIKPRKKRKPSSGFKDFQYELPGLHNKMRKKDSEIINLASSDEEVEPVRNGSSDPLPLPLPINKVPKVQLPPAHLTQHITTSATLITEPCLPTGTTTPSSPQRVHHLSPPLENIQLLIDLLEQMSRINSEFFQLFLEPKDKHYYVPTAHHKDWPRILTWSQMITAYEHGYNYLSEVTKNEGYSKDYGFPHPSVFPSTRTSTAIKSSL